MSMILQRAPEFWCWTFTRHGNFFLGVFFFFIFLEVVYWVVSCVANILLASSSSSSWELAYRIYLDYPDY